MSTSLIVLLFALIDARTKTDGFEYEFDKEGIIVGMQFCGSSKKLINRFRDQEFVSRVSKVKWVSLIVHDVTREEIECLRKVPELKSLRLGDCIDAIGLGPQVFEALGKLENLDSLEVYGDEEVRVTADELRQLNRLKSLSISGSVFRDDFSLSGLGDLSDLFALSLDIDNDLQNADWLERLVKLEALSIEAKSLSRDVASSIGQLRELRTLTIGGFIFDRAELAVLQDLFGNSCGYLKDLEIEVFSSQDLSQLGRFSLLERLSVSTKNTEPFDASFVKRCPQLRTVHVRAPIEKLNVIDYLSDQHFFQMHGRLELFSVRDLEGSNLVLDWKRLVAP